MTHVLVLNQDYQAISLCAPERAMVLIFLDKAELVADRTERKMRSVRASFPYPSIIRLRRYTRLPYRRVPLTREHVYRRDGHRCVYCGNTQHLTLDHVIPKAKGGRTHWTNLVTACRACNAKKGDFSLEEAGMALAHPPYRPSFLMLLGHYAGPVQESWLPYLMMA